MHQERPRPKETRMFRHVPMQAIAETLKTLSVPITITQMFDQAREQLYYTYQVGTPTPEKPMGICIGANTEFLDAVKYSLEAVIHRQTEQTEEGEARQFATPKPLQKTPSPITDEWIVPEVERRGKRQPNSSFRFILPPPRHRRNIRGAGRANDA
jgi:hypothetical protein